MLFEEFIETISKKLFPKIYCLNYETYGLYFDKIRINTPIKKVMLTIDLSLEAIHFALKNKISLILSHHNLINEPIKKFNKPLINKLSLLLKYPISIFVLDSSFTAAEGGVSETIVNALYLKILKTLEIKNNIGLKIPIGRICIPLNYPNEKSPFTLEDLIKRLKKNFNLHIIPYVGELERTIKRICIVGGDIPNSKLIKKALRFGCDCFISGKFDYYDAVIARDIGLNLIEASHYKIEILAMKKLVNILSLEFPHVEFSLFESKDPFKIYI